MGTHPIFESDFDCLTDVKMVLFSILIQDENDFDFDKEIFRHYKRMIDFNFTYLQEIINCYCAKKGRINDKTEDGKKGIVPNYKKSHREARKCKMAYKMELDKIKELVGYDADIYPAFFDTTKDSKTFLDRAVQTHEAWLDANHAQMNGDSNENQTSPNYGRIRPSAQPTRSTTGRTSLRGRGGRVMRGRGIDRANSNGIDSHITTFSTSEPNQTSSPTPNQPVADHKPRSRSKSPNIDTKTFQPNYESTQLKPSLDSFGGPFGNTIEPRSFEDDSEDRNINTSTIIEPCVSQIDLDVVHVAIKNEDDSRPPTQNPRDDHENHEHEICDREIHDVQDRDFKNEIP